MRLSPIWPFSRAPNQDWFGRHGNHSLIRAGSWSFLANNLQSALQIISGIILARLLVPEDYGKLTLIMVIYNLLSQINSINLSNALVQKEELTEQQASNLFWINILVSAGSALALLGIGFTFSHIYKNSVFINLSLIFGLLLILDGSASVHSALLKRAMRFNFHFWNSLWLTPPSIAVAAYLAHSGAGAYAVTSMSVIGGILGRVALFRYITWHPKIYRKNAGINAMLRFGGISSVTMLVDFIYQQSQTFFLGQQSNISQVGLYNRGQTLFYRPFGQVMGPLLQVFLPALSARQNDSRSIQNFVTQATWLLSVVLLPFALWVLAFGEEISAAILGDQWSLAGEVMGALAIATIPWILSSALFTSLSARGLPGKGLWVRVILMPFFLYFSYTASSEGAVAVAWVFAIFQWLALLPSIWTATYRLKPGFKEMILLTSQIMISVVPVALLYYGAKTKLYEPHGPFTAQAQQNWLIPGMLLTGYLAMLASATIFPDFRSIAKYLYTKSSSIRKGK